MIFSLLMAMAPGCSTKQQYTVLSRSQSGKLLAERNVVVEVTVKEARSSTEWSLTQPLGNGKHREDALVSVDRVLKGRENALQLKLINYRPLTTQESSVFPDEYGIHNNLRLLLAYDFRLGDSYGKMCIVPVGNAPEFNEALRRLHERQPVRPASSRAAGRIYR